MNYIILDMEWDSAYFVPQKRFLNQILQIGAVKLDSSFNIVDTFDVTIRSSFSKRVSKRFVELTGITKEMMLAGIPLKDAVLKYNEFVGTDSVTMTWSDTDIRTIIENETALLGDLRFRLDKYLDLQKFIQGELALIGHKCESQISLGNAAEVLGISTESYELHTAKDDSVVCALLLKHCYNKERFEKLIKDTSNPDFFERLLFKPYFITDYNDSRIPTGAFDFSCPFCGGKIDMLGKHWRIHNRNFSMLFECKNCEKKLIGRVSVRQMYDDIKLSKKIVEKVERPKEDDLQPVSEEV